MVELAGVVDHASHAVGVHLLDQCLCLRVDGCGGPEQIFAFGSPIFTARFVKLRDVPQTSADLT